MSAADHYGIWRAQLMYIDAWIRRLEDRTQPCWLSQLLGAMSLRRGIQANAIGWASR